MIAFSAPIMSHRRLFLRPFVLIGSFAVISAGILIGWTYLSRMADGRMPTDGISPLYWEIPNAAIWILFFPVLFHVTRKNPLHADPRISRFLIIHGCFALLFGAAHLELNILISGLLFESAGIPFQDTNPWCPWSSSIRMAWRILFYCLAAAVCYAVEFFDRSLMKRLENLRMEAEIQSARLKQMKMRIDPDFVDQALSDVASLMQTNTRRAVNTIARLGTFFRSLQWQEEETTLSQEVKVIRSYFDVETERSSGRVRLAIRCGRELLRIQCPAFPIQALVLCFYAFRTKNSNDCYKLRLSLYRKKKETVLILRDNLPSLSITAPLIAELHQVVTAAGGEAGRYRIDPHSRGVRIRFTDGAAPIGSRFSKTTRSTSSRKTSHLPLWGAACALAILYFLTRRLLTIFSAGGSLSPSEFVHLGYGLLLGGMSVPAILMFAKIIQLRSKFSFLMHIVLSVLLTIVLITIEKFLRSPASFRLFWGDAFAYWGNVIRFPDQILLYWGILLITNAFWNYRSYTREQIRRAHLQSDLSGAQLKALEMQLHPHFLFNTLHAINGLILMNKSAAAKMLKRLQDFLQMTLKTSNQHLVPFDQELQFLECYLDIQKIRFGDRLKVRMDIDPATRRVHVPHLILQPIVENAVRHGITGLVDGGEIHLQAERRNGTLRIAVEDNGPGLPAANPDTLRQGLGLRISALRLHHLYGDSHQFCYQNRKEGGFEVKMQIPVSL